jgi:hypothetical protein
VVSRSRIPQRNNAANPLPPPASTQYFGVVMVAALPAFPRIRAFFQQRIGYFAQPHSSSLQLLLH